MWCSAKVDSRQAGTAYFLIATFTRAAHRADGSGSIIPRRCGRTLPSAYGATNRVHSHCIGMDGVSHHCVDDLVRHWRGRFGAGIAIGRHPAIIRTQRRAAALSVIPGSELDHGGQFAAFLEHLADRLGPLSRQR